MSGVTVITFGCRLNTYESEVMRAEAEKAGLNNAVLVNTCAVTGEAVRQARQAIRRARQKGMRVYGEPLAQHLILDESEYQSKDWVHAARRVMSPPFRSKQHQDSLSLVQRRVFLHHLGDSSI